MDTLVQPLAHKVHGFHEKKIRFIMKFVPIPTVVSNYDNPMI